MSREALAMLAMQVAPLREIEAWPPCGALLSDLWALLSDPDGGNLTQVEVARLRKWASRWARLAPELQKFYAEHAGARECSSALWHILDDQERPAHWQRGQLIRMFEQAEGYEPSFSMCPSLRRTT